MRRSLLPVPGQATVHTVCSRPSPAPIGSTPEQDPRADRRLPRNLRRRREVTLAFDERSIHQVVSNIEEPTLKKQLAPAIARRSAALAFFLGSTAPSAATRASSRPSRPSPATTRRTPSGSPTASSPSLWKRSAPDPMLAAYRDDYRWLTDVYESVRPTDIARTAGLARPRREDHRPHQRARSGRGPAGRGHHRARRPDHRGPDAG